MTRRLTIFAVLIATATLTVRAFYTRTGERQHRRVGSRGISGGTRTEVLEPRLAVGTGVLTSIATVSERSAQTGAAGNPLLATPGRR